MARGAWLPNCFAPVLYCLATVLLASQLQRVQNEIVFQFSLHSNPPTKGKYESRPEPDKQSLSLSLMRSRCRPTVLAALALVSILLCSTPASALLVGDEGLFEPIIVQIKDSLRTSLDLDQELAVLASLEKENGLTEVQWYAGPKLLVTLSFPKDFTEDQAQRTISLLQECGAVEKVVAQSASNLEFRPADFIRAYEPDDAIPEAALRGLDADRIGQKVDSSDTQPPPVKVDLSQIPHVPNRLIVRWKEEYLWNSADNGFLDQIADFNATAGCRVVDEISYSPQDLTQVLEFDDEKTLADRLDQYYKSGLAVYVQPDYLYVSTAIPNDRAYDESPGPSLPVAGKLLDPLLDVLTTGESNDQWATTYLPLREELGEAGLLPTQVAESLLWPTFAAGTYSFRLRGKNATTGVGLISFYEY